MRRLLEDKKKIKKNKKHLTILWQYGLVSHKNIAHCMTVVHHVESNEQARELQVFIFLSYFLWGGEGERVSALNKTISSRRHN